MSLKLNAPSAFVVAVKTAFPSHLSATTRTPNTPRPVASTTVPKKAGCSLFHPSTFNKRPVYLCAGGTAGPLPGGGAGGRTTTGGASGCTAGTSGESAGSLKYARSISAAAGAATDEPSPPPATKTVTTIWGLS